MASRLRPTIQSLQSGWRVYALLAVILFLAYLALAHRGFTLGFYGDVVAYQYQFKLRGVLGGMNWLVAEYWHRHLLGGWLAAPLHLLAPERYEIWYALSIGLHFVLAPVAFLFVDALQCGQRRWLGFAAALLFLFDTWQAASNIEFATGWEHRLFLIFALLSLVAYLRYIRSDRQRLSWYILSVMLYVFAIMTYEQSLFFFLLHPLIAIVEDRQKSRFHLDRGYVWLHIRDAILYVFFLLINIYLLLVLFQGGNLGLDLSPGYLTARVIDGLALVFHPLAALERLVHALSISQLWFVGALALLIAGGFLLWIRWSAAHANASPWSFGALAALGLAMAFLTAFNGAPSSQPFDLNPRLLFAASLGSILVLLCGLGWLAGKYPRWGSAASALVIAMILAPSLSFFFEHQALNLERDAISRRVHAAIDRAIPEFAEGALPYLLLLSDRDPERDLHLVPRDLNFPNVFALRYDLRGFAADAVLYSIAGRRNPATIRLTESGIISPLKRGEVIAYDRLVIIRYDSQADSVSILERLPADALAKGNFDIRADVDMATNWALLPANARK